MTNKYYLEKYRNKTKLVNKIFEDVTKHFLDQSSERFEFILEESGCYINYTGYSKYNIKALLAEAVEETSFYKDKQNDAE